VNGLKVDKVTLKKEDGEGKLTITADKNAPAGEHTATIRAKGKFNNMNVETSVPVVIKVEAAQ
jgi:uncharacterized membrane protein